MGNKAFYLLALIIVFVGGCDSLFSSVESDLEEVLGTVVMVSNTTYMIEPFPPSLINTNPNLPLRYAPLNLPAFYRRDRLPIVFSANYAECDDAGDCLAIPIFLTELNVSKAVSLEEWVKHMLTAEQMEALSNARGIEFDRLFLEGMIQHHQGAIDMVETLFNSSGAAQESTIFGFAEDIDADQQMEIDRMRALLEQLR